MLAFNDVLNQQRQSIYARRHKILTGTHADIDELLEELIQEDSKLLKVVSAKKEELGEEEFYVTTHRLLLQVNDLLWVEHLEIMYYLRSSVNLRAYGQRDPLLE